MRMMSWRECVYWNNQHENLPSSLRRAWTFLAPSMLCAAWIFSSFDRTRWAKDLYVLWGHSWWSLLMAERLRSAGSINPCLTKLNSLASSAAFQLFVVLLAVWRGGMMCGVFMPWYGFVPCYTIPYPISLHETCNMLLWLDDEGGRSLRKGMVQKFQETDVRWLTSSGNEMGLISI